MRRWVILGLLTVGIIIAYVARINFSVALATESSVLQVVLALACWGMSIALTTGSEVVGVQVPPP